MAIGILSRSERAHPLFFWLGAVSVSAGVVLHLPMYLRSASMNFHLAGMRFDTEMFFGMALIVAGVNHLTAPIEIRRDRSRFLWPAPNCSQTRSARQNCRNRGETSA